ncbi:MAG: cell division protein SepF [Oscillospiraceae bacterium]|nr:cell division protein SepF [Oscillospiraceae bacterium]
MGFLEKFKQLTQPYDEEDDFYEGADMARKKEPAVTAAQLAYEDTFSAQAAELPEPAEQPEEQGRRAGFLEGLGFGKREQGGQNAPRAKAPAARPLRPLRERTVSFGGNDTQVILFNPKSFEEAGELVSYLQMGRSLVMTLEGQPTEKARRLLDFISGITFAMEGKVTPVAGKTYFITPQNVDLVAPTIEQPESDGKYF